MLLLRLRLWCPCSTRPIHNFVSFSRVRRPLIHSVISDGVTRGSFPVCISLPFRLGRYGDGDRVGPTRQNWLKDVVQLVHVRAMFVLYSCQFNFESNITLWNFALVSIFIVLLFKGRLMSGTFPSITLQLKDCQACSS